MQKLKLHGVSLRKMCPYSELFWSVFSRIWTEYREIRSISPYSVQIWENADQNNSEYGHFSRSVDLFVDTILLMTYLEIIKIDNLLNERAYLINVNLI